MNGELRGRIGIAALAVVCLGWLMTAAASATGLPTLTITVKSAYLRSAPGLGATRLYSVFQGQTYPITGRLANSGWVRLEVAGGSSPAWAPVYIGTIQGSLESIPIVATASQPTITPLNVNAGPSTATAAAPSVRFTLKLTSAYGRAAPSHASAPTASLFKDRSYAVLGRLADGSWVRLAYADQPNVWVPAAYGNVSGNLNGVPVELTAEPPTLTATETPSETVASVSDVIRVGARAPAIFRYGQTFGNNPRVFSVVGDCNSVTPEFLGFFDDPRRYQLGNNYALLQETIDQFSGSFMRPSQAASSGFSAAAVLDPSWANPQVCQAGESPLACEFRLVRPSFALISLGTNSTWQSPENYEASLRAVIQGALDRGVVPILSTKADNLEGDDHMNAIVVRLAGEYDIPLWNFALAARALPDHGLGADGFHLTWGAQVFDDPQALTAGWQVRNLTALQALDAVWRAVR